MRQIKGTESMYKASHASIKFNLKNNIIVTVKNLKNGINVWNKLEKGRNAKHTITLTLTQQMH